MPLGSVYDLCECLPRGSRASVAGYLALRKSRNRGHASSFSGGVAAPFWASGFFFRARLILACAILAGCMVRNMRRAR